MKRTLFCIILFFIYSGSAFSEGSLDIRKIVDKAFRTKLLTLKGGIFELEMVIGKGKRKRSKKVFKIITEEKKGLLRSLIRVESPRDVKGTSFLFIEKEDGTTDQMMYLPSNRITRRIKGKKKDQRFMGSEFTFSDLEKRNIEDYDYRLLEEDRCDGKVCYVIEAMPRKKTRRYDHLVLWIEKPDNLLKKIEYVKSGRIIKRLDIIAYSKVLGQVVATEATMYNLKKDRWTRVTLIEGSARKLEGVPGWVFSRRGLESGYDPR